MTGCFIAASLPLCLTEAYDVFDHVINSTIVGLSFIAICILGQSLPFITLFVTTLAFIAHKLKGRWPYYILGSTALLCAVIYLVHGFHQGEFFNDSNRFMIWKMGIDHYLDGPITQQIFGLGLGTTQNLLFTWQGNSNDHWIWYHNDALQTLIEIGVVGFALCMWLAVYTWLKAWKTTGPYFACLSGIAVYATFNYPLRLAFPALFCALVMSSIIRPRLHP